MQNDFAEPSVGSGGNKTKNFSLEQGSNKYRIGPAYKSLAGSGRWNVNIETHFGYRSTPTDDNPKGFPRTFVCPRVKDRKTEIIKHDCGECRDTEALEEKVELRKQKLANEGKSEEEIDIILKPQKQYLKEHNLQKRHLVLAKNEQGEWGVLWLPWKALEALINRRKKILAEQGIDILSIKEGAWVDFLREGEGFRNTVYSCDVVTETEVLPNGKKAQVMKQEALEQSDFDQIRETCPDLSTVGTRLTDDQIDRLVESRGDTEIVDAIFNEAWEAKKGKREASASPAREATPVAKVATKAPPKRREYDEQDDEDAIAQGRAANGAGDDIPEEKIMGKSVGEKVLEKIVEKRAAEKAEVKVEKKLTSNEKAEMMGGPVAPDDEEAALAAQLEALRAKKAAAKAKADAKTVAEVIKPKPAPEPEGSPDDMPDDQFLEVYSKKRK